MLKELKDNFNIKDYVRIIKGSEIEKVSFFFKDNIEEMKTKKIFFLDLEFSQNRIIFEVGGFIYDNGKITEHIYNEYSLPVGEKVWDFNLSRYLDGGHINSHKSVFSDIDRDTLLKIIEDVDYIVIHNYVAELTCFHKLLFKGIKYNKNDIDFFKEGKVICTNYSFNNKYFKNKQMKSFSNAEVSKQLGWNVIEDIEVIYFEHKELDIRFKIKKPIEVVGKLHNSYYDSAITLTNFYSLIYLMRD